ncbi:carbohydrate ABC transporter permease [Anaeromicropila herbilytica]|uniref:ABC transporter permease n=1 Tax=Anaeromicropila herbilytica TaxID=2785025 RepID=A0A7R7ELB9_9FIRM|nr:carbohydrate ABC transporter permease [Anaeromicropila herbilytica]BCN30884.1 ABC transporter permease [Anaeromicropila herbilytica]
MNDTIVLKKRNKIEIRKIILLIICLIVAFIMIIPFVWMVSASFKERTEIFTKPIQWIPKVFRSVNYNTVFHEIPFPTYFFNTAKITICVTILQLITCSMAAFAFAKLSFPGRDKLFLGYLATMMVPWHAIMIPQFMVVQKLGLYDNHLSLILTGAFSAFGVFILRQNMLSIPNSLNEAAKIDGCGPFKIYTKIAIPLSKTGLATLTALTFTCIWNDYMGPMIYLDTDTKKTIQLGLATFKREYDTNYGAIMAGTVISLIPVVIVYAFAQKYIVEGVACTGVKG